MRQTICLSVIFCALASSPSFALLLSGSKNITQPPAAKIQNGRSYNLFLIGEFLYWKFSSPNLTYGRDGVLVATAGKPIQGAGQSYYPDFKREPGFRVGIGVKGGPEKKFDFITLYTHLNTQAYGSANSAGFSGPFIPLNWFSGPLVGSVFTFASLQTNLSFSWIEAQSGYTFTINPNLTLRPYIALASYLINGTLNAQYNFSNSSVYYASYTHGGTNSWSLGPKMGLDFTLRAAKSFGIYTTVNFTQQSSHITMNTIESIKNLSTQARFINQMGQVTETGNFSYVGLEIGPVYDAWLTNNKYHLQLRATYVSSNLLSGANLSFLNGNNQDTLLNSEIRGFNFRAMLEF